MMGMCTASGLLTKFVAGLNGKIEGGIPEPHRSKLFDVVGIKEQYKFNKDIQCGNCFYVSDIERNEPLEDFLKRDMEKYVPPEYRKKVVFNQSVVDGTETIAWGYNP